MPGHLVEATYTISNVKSSNFLSLAYSGRKEVVACFDGNLPGSKWNVLQLPGSNRYHLQNFDNPSLYAWCKHLSPEGEYVIGSSAKKEWIIKKLSNSQETGPYIISPADNEEVFWGLEDNNADTPVELRSVPNVPQNQWHFRFHSGPDIVKAIIDGLHLTLDWMDTTTRGPFEGRVSGIIQGSSLPKDATISFPKVSIVWQNMVIGQADMKATYGAVHADQTEDNVLLTPTVDHAILSNFVRAVLKEKSVSVEIRAETVSVHAGGKQYRNIGSSFRKSVLVGGFNYLKGQVSVENIKIEGSDPKGDSLAAIASIAIKNPSNVSVLIDELPVDVFYDGVKIASLTLSSFKLLKISSGTEYRAKVPLKFQPENSRDSRCKEFIASYITTAENLDISLALERTVIKLASTSVAIPRFTVASVVSGINKHFVTSCTAYIAVVRAPLTRKMKFTFEFENPIDAPLTIEFIKGVASRKGKRLMDFEGKELAMTVRGNATLESHKIRDARLLLSIRKMITYLLKSEIDVDVDLHRATVHIGKFNLPDLSFKLSKIKTTLKYSLLF